MKIITAEKSDFIALAEALRYADWLEVSAVYGNDVKNNVISFYDVPGIKWAIKTDNDILLAVLGLQPTEKEGVGIVWMLTTQEIHKHALEFIKLTEGLREAVFSIYNTVGNYVHSKNKGAIKWLKFVGAKLQDDSESSLKDFILFEIKKER